MTSKSSCTVAFAGLLVAFLAILSPFLGHSSERALVPSIFATLRATESLMSAFLGELLPTPEARECNLWLFFSFRVGISLHRSP